MKGVFLACALVASLGLVACSSAIQQTQHFKTQQTPINHSKEALVGNYEFSSGSEPRDVYIAVTISQGADNYFLSFQGAHPDAHGAAPEGEGTGKLGSDNILRFTYGDSFSNRGSGSFRRTTRGYALSIEITEVADPRCMMFYGDFTLHRVNPKKSRP